MMGMDYCLIEGFIIWDVQEAIYGHEACLGIEGTFSY